ncbi:amphi-Trp domain-containing protein [Thiomicrospira microaerophila]|uniref:amphi-Trp domain-containing protein n=1 Tax=Thiomicrospira microaerophila TaxID=406020 RepID=UPI00201000C5|nr:amphi-Trp domain-containing protein [Thiomicrospira microaerophila]UQB42614.1 amphi-Trp domain-containing protein [Thiomicrospira microaerophila]
MAKTIHTFEHESLQDKEAIINYLAVVSDGFAKGHIQLSNEDEEVTLTPQGLARLKIKAKQAKNHQEIRITIAWTAEQNGNTDSEPRLKIKAGKSKNKKGAKN